MTRQDFLDWKQQPVTREIFNQLRARIQVLQETLGDSAGENPANDRFVVGTIQGYKDILLMEYEETSEESR